MTEAKIRIPRPAPAERARWLAEKAIAYLIKGAPLPWKEWMVGATVSEIEQAEIDLGQAIREGVPAWGWHPLKKKRKRIPSKHFRDEMIENKVSVARQAKVVARIDGNVGTSPPSRIADYVGPLWRKIEVDSVRLRQARPRPAPSSPQGESEPLPPPKLKRAKAVPTRGKRDPVIERMKAFYPLDGIRPKSVSISALTRRINKLPEFKENQVSDDTVGRADREIKEEAARKK